MNQRDGRDIRFGGLDDAIDAAVAGVGQVSDLFQNVLKLCDIIKRYVDKSVGAVAKDLFTLLLAVMQKK